MTAEKFVNRIGNHLQRRGFLKKLGAGAAGVTAAMVGSAATANADTAPAAPLCCNLCEPNTPIGQPCYGAYCTWAWNCCYGGTRYRCVEGYYQGQCDPEGDCTSGWRCSHMSAIGTC